MTEGKIFERQLDKNNIICTVLDDVYGIGQTNEERKEFKQNEKKKGNKKPGKY